MSLLPFYFCSVHKVQCYIKTFICSLKAFPPILHFMRSGELHAPKNLCGLVFQSELEYWGIDANLMKECCWIQYCSDLENMKSLSAFHSRHIENDPADTTTVRGRLWTFLNDPHSSKWARVGFCANLTQVTKIKVVVLLPIPYLKYLVCLDMAQNH